MKAAAEAQVELSAKMPAGMQHVHPLFAAEEAHIGRYSAPMIKVAVATCPAFYLSMLN